MKNVKVTLNQIRYLIKSEYYNVYLNDFCEYNKIFNDVLNDEVSFYEKYGDYFVKEISIDYEEVLNIAIEKE